MSFIKMKFTLFGLPSVLLIAFTACKKGPGEGGTSAIRGKVLVYDYNGNYPQLDTTYYKAEEDVYIIYGDDNTYDDNYKTSFDGSYEFQYLRKGTYKVFVYSDDSTGLSPSGKIIVSKTVDINSNKSTVDVPDLVMVKN